MRHGTPATPPRPDGDIRTNPRVLRRFGRLAGLLYLICGLTSIPSSLLLDSPPAAMVPVTALVIAGGLVWLAFPWERANPRWIHVAVGLATLAVAISVAAADRTYAFFGVVIAVYVAYAFTSRAAIGAHLALLTAAVLGPLAYDPATARETLQVGALAVPSIVIVAVVVTVLRERDELRERSYRRFAEEALALASRINEVVEPNGIDDVEGNGYASALRRSKARMPSGPASVQSKKRRFTHS